MKNRQSLKPCFGGLVKKTLLANTMMMITLVPITKAQFLGGFFSQQSQKEKLMAEQVTGINIYLNAVKGGYKIMHTGLETAHDLKGGTFQLHTGYFNSLEQIAPVIQTNPKGKAIAELQQQLAGQFDQEISWQVKAQQLKPDELAYLKKVAEKLKQVGNTDMAELTDVLTPGKLQLSDEQRLERVDKIYTAMKDKAAFASSFTGKCRQVAVSRQKAKSEQEQIRKLYGIQ